MKQIVYNSHIAVVVTCTLGRYTLVFEYENVELTGEAPNASTSEHTSITVPGTILYDETTADPMIKVIYTSEGNAA